MAGTELEVEYLRATHLIPIASTDYEQQLRQVQTAVSGNTSESPAAAPAAPAHAEIIPASNDTAPAPNAPSGSATVESAIGAPPAERVEKLLGVEVVRSRDRNIEGGDYDDKIDHITLRVNLTNTSPTVPIEKLSGKIYVFAESILNRGLHRLLAAESFDFSLAPRQKQEPAG